MFPRTYRSSHSAISYELMSCIPGRNLCTPDRPTVEEIEPGHYHVILPAHLEWDASVPLRVDVEIANASGIVCWDLPGRGASGCTGPAGEASGSGALIIRAKDGRTYYSADREFADNQGYFEFDVNVR